MVESRHFLHLAFCSCQTAFRTFSSAPNQPEGHQKYYFSDRAMQLYCHNCFFQISDSIVFLLYCSDLEPGRKWSVLEKPFLPHRQTRQVEGANSHFHLALVWSAILVQALVLCLIFR